MSRTNRITFSFWDTAWVDGHPMAENLFSILFHSASLKYRVVAEQDYGRTGVENQLNHPGGNDAGYPLKDRESGHLNLKPSFRR